jgi:putative hydrolase of the HAD superfamily
MNRISTIFWDIGGVLLTNGWGHAQRDVVLGRFGIERSEFERRHETANDPWEKDLIGVNEYLAATVFYEPRDFTPEEMLNAMKAESRELPDGGLGILEELAASEELELCVLNNEARALNDHRLQTFGLTSLFDCFLSSCHLGLRKPDPKIYARALDIVQREPGAVIFIDDREENVSPALALGMHGIRFQDPAQLRGELSALGVVIAS